MAHLAVIGLVLFASAVGIAQAQDQASTGWTGGIFALISPVRAGAADAEPLRSTTLTLQAQPDEGDPELLARNTLARLPAQPPLPTPVPVDPNAAPLPAPASASVGQTERSTRVYAAPPVTVASNGQLAWPVAGGSISQWFHAGHLAIDVAAPGGNTVMAAEAGVVTAASWRNNGGGLVVTIDHGNGIVTGYNHLGSIWVSPGQSVARGQGIGSVGCTGICTGPHVHFEVIVNGVIDNPLRYLP